MRVDSSDWVISDLERVAGHFNVDVRHGKGSHVYFTFVNGLTLSVPAKRPIKAFYVEAFLEAPEVPSEEIIWIALNHFIYPCE